MQAASDWAQENDKIFPVSGPVIPILKSYEAAQRSPGGEELKKARERLTRELQAAGEQKAARQLRALVLYNQSLPISGEQLCGAVKAWAAADYGTKAKPPVLDNYKTMARLTKSSKAIKALSHKLRNQGLSREAARSLRRGMPVMQSTPKDDPVRRALIPEWLESNPLM